MFADVEQKIKKKNEILFSRDSACLQGLLSLLREQTHRTLVLWAFDCAQEALALFEEKYPEEKRPETALALSQAWARGEVKMPIARRAILDAHAAAKDVSDRASAALCHAVGQACATVHAATHAPGLPFYELTALVLRRGGRDYEAQAEEKIGWYISRLLYWREQADQPGRPWAKFLLKERNH